ncbi:MAG: hypothetical protein ACQGVK_22485 [Myxococcota bacterium]
MRRRPADPGASPIRFGTSGWRGVLGEEVTFPRLRAAAWAAVRWLAEQPDAGARRRVLVGYDGRFASEKMARMVAAAVGSRGLVPVFSDRPVATPVLSAQVPGKRALGALVVTASHNPPDHHGLKVFNRAGGGIDDGAARRIESLAARALDTGGVALEEVSGRRVDLVTPYLERLLPLLDVGALRRAGPRVVYDAMHGMGAGLLDQALGRCGVRVDGLRLDVDPRFGGTTPDPIAERLADLRARVARARGPRVGLATDGDGDRLAVVDGAGNVLSETQMVALLVDHLADTGRLGRGVAISRATGSLVERVARSHGLEAKRHPMGFKHLSAALAAGEADAAGDESGGFAIAAMGRDKDGIASGCLLAEMLCRGGEAIAARVRRLERRHGAARCGRRALRRDGRSQAGLESLIAAPPARLGGARVRGVDLAEGLHLAFEDGFLMWRMSGTEDVIRIYGEAPGPKALARRLDLGARLLRRRAGP